jgi:MFS family permease
VLQTGVNIGVLLATASLYLLAQHPPRYVFLVGVLPALLVLWIRRAVPEPEVWEGAHRQAGQAEPRFADLFRPPVRRIAVLTLLVCALSLTAHWAFLYWYLQHLRSLLPDYFGPLLPKGLTLEEQTELLRQWGNQWISKTMSWLMVASITGNFLAAAMARLMGYRRAIGLMCLVYFAAMLITYSVPRDPNELWYGYMVMGLCQGLFGLFTMYMPPLFPVLLRTTGAGFCYNIGRIAAGLGTVFFMLVAPVGNFRIALIYAAFLFLPAAAIAWMLPEPPDEASPPEVAPE